jgi:alpha/beta superfamily hydrolase
MGRQDAVTAPRHASPIYFGDAATPLFGWLHVPTATPSLAVAVCSPFGHEGLSSHRTIRALADGLCAAGILTLRFDYEGTGNSAGRTNETSEPMAWRSNILAALDLLARVAPDAQQALIGLRLGALLALDAASHGNNLKALVLIAPPRSGRQYLR